LRSRDDSCEAANLLPNIRRPRRNRR